MTGYERLEAWVSEESRYGTRFYEMWHAHSQERKEHRFRVILFDTKYGVSHATGKTLEEAAEKAFSMFPAPESFAPPGDDEQPFIERARRILLNLVRWRPESGQACTADPPVPQGE